ncbi:MAG: hypothetical protein CL674_09805 [Bdellovibrionaceae bacterium]|nr:hypothetical protein [Pseudobdellovibrionaceae bacterium]|tara:strand:- start:12004 stop:14400 length:2397 start_codon:yes stop_codon:yes gene_type:complete
MNQHYPWAKGLQIPNDVIAVWEMQAAGSDLLRWALANGKVLEHIYLDWAKNYYKLPSLSQSFFEKSPNPSLWEKWGRFDWSGTFLPIYEYDGVLYIACLEPPNAFQQQVIASLNTRTGLLLAPISGMKKWWTIVSPVLQMYQQLSGLPPELAQFAEVGKTTPVQNPAMNQNPYAGQNPTQTQNPMTNYNGFQNQTQNPANPYYNQQNQAVNPMPNPAVNNGFQNNQMPGMQNSNPAYAVNPYQDPATQFANQNQVPVPPNSVPTQAPVNPQNFNQQAFQVPGANHQVASQQPQTQENFQNDNFAPNPAQAMEAGLNLGNNTVATKQEPELASQEVNPQAQANVPQQETSFESEKPADVQASVPVAEPKEPQVASENSMPPIPEAKDEAFTMTPDLPPVEPTKITDMPPTPEEAPLVNKAIPKATPAISDESEVEEFDDITQVRSLDDALETLEAKHNELLQMDEKNREKQSHQGAVNSVENEVPVIELDVDEEAENLAVSSKEEVSENTVEINFDDFKLEDSQEQSQEDSAIDLDADVLEDTGIVGLDLSDLNLSKDEESLLQEESNSSAEEVEEDAIEGLDFSQMDFSNESTDNLRPPSAHLLDSDEDTAVGASIFELGDEQASATIKIEHPEDPKKVAQLKEEDNSFGGDVEKQAAHKSLQRIAGICGRRMILQMHRGMLKPFHWEGDWTENPNVKKEVELAENSIFKIVCDTKMPYHGYVVRNDVNDLFLDAFNKGKLPDHATLIPVTLNKNVVAVILGFCEKERVDEIDLHLWERYADEYADAILEINRNHVAA